MIFVFHILVFTILLSNIDYCLVKAIESLGDENDSQAGVKFEDVADDMPNYLPKPQSHRKMNLNYSKFRVPNLKSNIFDKMLSDEMLSIKQQSFEKDMTYTPILSTSNKVSVHTPTLELKQKWPIIEFLANPIPKGNYTEENNGSQESHKLEEDSRLKWSENKILGLRSLDHASVEPRRSFSKSHEACNCVVKNPATSHALNDPVSCTHTEKDRSSSASNTPYPAFYIPFQSYYLTAVTYPYAYTYYQPFLVNDMKQKKKKHRKTTTSSDSYDGDYDTEIDNYSEIGPNRIKPRPSSILPDVTPDKFEQNAVEELNKVYGESFIKKCYCSSSVRKDICIPFFGFVFVFYFKKMNEG